MRQVERMRRILKIRTTLIQMKDLIDEEQANCDAVAMRYIQSLQDELVCVSTLMAPSERNKAIIPEVTRCGALVVRNESRAVGNVEDFVEDVVHYITPEDLFLVPHLALIHQIKEAKETRKRIRSHQISMTARLLEAQRCSAQNLNRSAVLLTLLLATAFLLGGLKALPPSSSSSISGSLIMYAKSEMTQKDRSKRLKGLTQKTKDEIVPLSGQYPKQCFFEKQWFLLLKFLKTFKLTASSTISDVNTPTWRKLTHSVTPTVTHI